MHADAIIIDRHHSPDKFLITTPPLNQRGLEATSAIVPDYISDYN
jgi:hypothetical protein